MIIGFLVIFVVLALVLAVVIVRHNRRKAAAEAATRSRLSSSAPLRSAIVTSDSASVAPAVEPGSTAQHFEPAIAVEPEPEVEAEEEKEPTAAELIAEGDAHMHEFAYDDAISAYESAEDAVTAEHGRDSLEFADLLVKIEDAYFARDNQDDTDELNCDNHLRALAIMERKLGVFDPRLLPVLNRIVAFNLLVDKPNDADGLIRRQQMIESREQARLAKEKLATAQALAGDATVPAVHSQSLPSPASPTAAGEEVKAHLQAALDTGSARVDEAAREGDKAVAEFDYDAAVDHYNEALEAAQEAFGRDSVRLVPVLTRLSAAFFARDLMETDSDGDSYTDPVDHMRLALSLLVKDAGSTDVRLLPLLTDMVAFCDLEGEHFKAGSYLSMIDKIEDAARRASRM